MDVRSGERRRAAAANRWRFQRVPSLELIIYI